MSHRSRILCMNHEQEGVCKVCGYHGWMPAFDLTLDGHLCSPCIEPTLQAEKALVFEGMEHPGRSLMILNP